MKVKGLTFQRLKPQDMEMVLQIAKKCFSYPYPRSYFERPFQKYPQGFITAKINGKIAGYICGVKKNNTGKTISLAVLPDFRGKGIGTHLFKSLLEHFKKSGLKRVVLYARISNKKAVSFHQRMGFKIIKTIKKHYPDREDAYLMEKEI